MSRKTFAASLLILALVQPVLPAKKKPALTLAALATKDLNQDEAILHSLNRLGFGPRPGDLERVRQMGLDKYIEQQLNPESIENAGLQARLDPYPTIAMSTEKLLEAFPDPAMAARRMGISQEEYRKKMQDERATQRRRADTMQSALTAMPGPQRIVGELSLAKLTRAVYSERQLEEVMADFWFNHFNVFFGKGEDRWLIPAYERDVLRAHALGKFKDLLLATSQSPAMLFYLDNWMSTDPKTFERQQVEMMRQRGRNAELSGNVPMPPDFLPPQPPQRRGLNENYARELMELHTLGVDGGYTQQDVIEVARCFTGWTLANPRQNPRFNFDERIHDPDTKTVLGHKITAGDMKDGEQVIELLSRHPNTAKFISTKLARRFVSDDPPAALVARMSKTFLDTDGDIRAALRAMIYAPEFWSRDTYRAKIKKPFELVASATRALGADLEIPLTLVQWSERIGEPLYRCLPPTGYSDKADAWVNTGALLNRMNFALALSGNRLRGAKVDVPGLLGADPQQALAKAIEVFLAGQISQQTRATIEKQLGDAGVVAGLVLGSPEFQRR